jgi:hypothetical protein
MDRAGLELEIVFRRLRASRGVLFADSILPLSAGKSLAVNVSMFRVAFSISGSRRDVCATEQARPSPTPLCAGSGFRGRSSPLAPEAKGGRIFLELLDDEREGT